ncbi:MAG: bifunctional hydroxymethylpyrimidine kinase/phosphomethylpyrimidine kinase [Eggerthellaceae bacterium]|nr:bifunctional hydroxymethylpyrimidine kinase/phosphomethylpyrimidine kinase [Eggerthellaceae bacterium]
MRNVLSIAGSDSSGGAGIQADIKTITAYKLYAMTVITALTAQNTQGVQAVEAVSPKFVAQQMDSVFTDIFPDAIKIGMIPNSEIAEIVADKLCEYKVKNIVLDPVMIATSNDKLIEDEAIYRICERLFPLVNVITPNIPEAEILSCKKISNKEEMMSVAELLNKKYKVPILVKGGHLVKYSNDFLYYKCRGKFFNAQRINTENTHGTGCTLSSAIACGLAQNKTLEEAISSGKKYIIGALKSGLNIGKGGGPINHVWNLEG